MMWTSWARGHTKTSIPEKSSKLGLIGMWHKDNLYLDTSTIGNENPHPTNIDLESKFDFFLLPESYHKLWAISKIIKTKTHKLIPYAVVRKEEKKRNKSDIRLIILETNMSLNTTSSHFLM